MEPGIGARRDRIRSDAVSPPGKTIWRSLRKSLRSARRRFRAGDADGLHDVRVVLRRISVVAEAGDRRKVARGAAILVRKLSPLRQIEVDRQLVAELARSGALPPQDARAVDTLLDARWRRGVEKAFARLSGGRAAKLEARLGRAREDATLAAGLERRSQGGLAIPSELDEDGLHRLRIAVKKRRYALMARRDLGASGLEGEIARCQALQDVLGRANDWRSFRRDLVRMRERKRADPVMDPALDAVFDLVSDSAERTLRTARETVAASRPAPSRTAAGAAGEPPAPLAGLARTSRSLLKGSGARRADS